MDKHEAHIRDGDEASRILNSAVFAEAFADVRQALMQELEATPTTKDGDDRAGDIRRRLKCLAQIRSALSYRVDTGKLAQKELSLKEKAAQGARRFMKTLST